MRSFSLFTFVTLFAAASALCGSTQTACGGACFTASQGTYTCATDNNGVLTLCPINSPSACNKGCYNPAQYSCYSYGLGPKAATPATPASTWTPTPTPAPSSTVAAAAAPSSTVAAKPSTCTVNCYGGPCCGNKCYSSSTYSCPIDSFTLQPVLCSLGFSACGGACYNPSVYGCNNGGLVPAGAAPAPPIPTYAPASTYAAATPSTVAPVNVAPVPAPSNRPAQTADLRIINSCKSTLWFEARYGNQGAALPGQTQTSLMALPGAFVDYTIPDTGLAGTRFWAKYGCDANGKNCAIGDQMQYWPNPPGGCPAAGCTPPVDSLFEATWGCRPGSACNAQNPTTWFDTSQVDGWTIPYKVTPNGDTSKCDCIGNKCGFSGVDASTLDLAKCPSKENLVAGGQSLATLYNGVQVNLSSVDLRIIKNNQVLGCMSPCKRLNWGAPYGLSQPELSGATMWMCCPTPTPASCSPANGCISPTACRAGPIENTQFVAAVHAMAPGVYSYSYDDGVGLHACPAGVATYTMEFCPAGSAQYPLQL